MKARRIKGSWVVVAAAAAAVWAFSPKQAEAVFTSQQKVAKTAVASLTGAGTVSMTVTVKKVSDNTTDTNVTWSNVTLPTGFKTADHYVQLDSVLTQSGAGIQIYTDNMGTGANPLFTGVPANVDPSGLVDTTNTALRLPMAWSVKTPNDPAPIATNPNNNQTTDQNAAQWVFMKDRSTVNIPATNTTSFVDGQDFVTVVNSDKGLHATQIGFFPGTFPTTRVYLSANFGSAVTPRTYQTNKLTLESFIQ